MGSYREAYPSGGASASAAYHYSGAPLSAQRPHEALVGLPHLGDGARLHNLLALPGSGSVYGYGNLYASVESGYAALPQAPLLPSHNNDLHRGSLLSEIHSRTFLARYGNVGGVVYAAADSHGRVLPAEPYSQTLRTKSWAEGSDLMALHGQSFYPSVSPSSLLSARTGVRTLGNTPDALVGNAFLEHRAEQNPPRSSQNSDSAVERKRKNPTLDELIKETWELHSLFRAGLATASKTSESKDNGAEGIMPKKKQGKQMFSTNDACDTGGKWGDTPLQEESHPDRAWYLPSKEAFETTSSWKELDALGKETKGTLSNNKHKELLPKQEQYAAKLQRFTCERVAEFMGNYSDCDDSDDESFVDSDDDVPNIFAESSHDEKSREEQAYEFFLQTFEENKALQKLYNEQCHVGKFECLVCSSIPGKRGKKYNGLVSVVMHASKIIKTKKKQEHRGYARALCTSLGWDLCRLPTMPRSSSPRPRCCIPANGEENTDVEKNEEVLKESESDKLEGASDNSGGSSTNIINSLVQNTDVEKNEEALKESESEVNNAGEEKASED